MCHRYQPVGTYSLCCANSHEVFEQRPFERGIYRGRLQIELRIEKLARTEAVGKVAQIFDVGAYMVPYVGFLGQVELLVE